MALLLSLGWLHPRKSYVIATRSKDTDCLNSLPRSPDRYGHSPNERTNTDPESCRTVPYDACDHESPGHNDQIIGGEPLKIREHRSSPPSSKRVMLRPPV